MKSEVYSWRLSGELKAELQRYARDEKLSLSELLERISHDWLAHRRLADETEQTRIRARARKAIGKISMGGGPWTNDKVRQIVRDNLANKYVRRYPD